MPELPEVEVVRRGLEDHLLGRRIEHLEILHPRAIRHGELHTPDGESLEGCTVTGTHRRGKYLWCTLRRAGEGQAELEAQTEADTALLIHLGMSGQMLITAPGECTSPHQRIRAVLDDGHELSFVDQRTFGYWSTPGSIADPWGSAMAVPASISHIRPDPFEAVFDLEATVERLRGKRREIKGVLLDQTVLSGIGNIYADEALWRAGVRPRRSAHLLSRPTLRRIVEAAAEVMAEALEQGGTSFDSLYVHVNGASGYFSRSLAVYGQQGRACPRCGEPIVRVTVVGRSSHYCRNCQR